ncbi:MAG: acetolactate synthase small subunit [Bacillota bacterium]
MRHTLAVLVANQPGVLARVAGLFSRRGFNIDSLAVGPTQDPSVSRMTIAVEGDERLVEQVSKQLNKLVDVIKVSDLSPEDSVSRELALIKVQVAAASQPAVLQIVEMFRAKVVDVGSHSLIIEATGAGAKMEAILEMLRRFGLVEVVRTGTIAMQRGGTGANGRRTQYATGEGADGQDLLRVRLQS